MSNIITLDTALYRVRELQDGCMAVGYYLALAGGTLNTGFSKNDIDLVAVPRTAESMPDELISYLRTKLGIIRSASKRCRGRPIDVYHFTSEYELIDIAVILQD